MVKKLLGFVLAVGLMGIALPALAAEGPTACVGSAVNVREAALGSAVANYTQSISSAYTARATALQKAYAQNLGNGTLRTDIKAAWTAFTSASQGARNAWRTGRNTAWSQFRASVKACKTTAVPTDSAKSSLEVSGQ